MKQFNIDKLSMLLSTDWFLPYWFVLGLVIRDEVKDCIQIGCREIVNQIMSGSKEYWLADFSEERVTRTTVLFQARLQVCRADTTSVKRISEILGEGKAPILEERMAWLLHSITQQLVDRSLPESAALTQPIQNKVKAIFESFQNDSSAMNFEEICLASDSQWDMYVRSTTPDLPSFLSDYLSFIQCKNEFEILWVRLNATLTDSEWKKLLNWYSAVGERLTGEPLLLTN